MLEKAIRVFIVFAILALIINLVPDAYKVIKTAVEWILNVGDGKWGCVIIGACIVEAILGK